MASSTSLTLTPAQSQPIETENMTLEDRNKEKRKQVEENHKRAQNIEIDMKARSQIIKISPSALSFRTPFRMVLSGPTMRNVILYKLNKFHFD
jgi:hypothetical protein